MQLLWPVHCGIAKPQNWVQQGHVQNPRAGQSFESQGHEGSQGGYRKSQERDASNGNGDVWETAKAIADRTWEGVPRGIFSQNVFQDTLASRDTELYLIHSGNVSWPHTEFKVK